MAHGGKYFVGSKNNEYEAALLYDKVAIQNHGIDAQCNFSYTKDQIIDFIQTENMIKGKKNAQL